MDTQNATETFDQRRQRWYETYDHNHTPDGVTIQIVPTQSAGDTKCSTCGRTIIIRADEARSTAWASGTPNGSPEKWQHTLECPEYEPHPNSIAGQPNYVPGPGRLGYNEPTA
ncbi:hypothetical protein GCM10027417_30570 [Glutamicibacter endophyticus]